MRILGTPGLLRGQVASRLASPQKTRYFSGIGILLQHVVKDNLGHPAEHQSSLAGPADPAGLAGQEDRGWFARYPE